MGETIKVKFATYIQNMYDGAACVRYFRTEQEAESFAAKDDERYCDDISTQTLEFDLEGNLLTKERE